MASLAANLASQAMKATGLFSKDENAIAPVSPVADKKTNTNDVETDAGGAGQELIKNICSTLNSPGNTLFSAIVENSVKTYFSQNNPDAKKTILATVDSNLNKIFDSLINEESSMHVFHELIKNNQAEYEPWFLEIIDGITTIPEFKNREISSININRESAYRISTQIVDTIKTASLSGEIALSTNTQSILGGSVKKKRFTHKYRLGGISKKHTRSSHIYNLWGGGDDESVSLIESKEKDIKTQYNSGKISEEDAIKQTDDLLNQTNEMVATTKSAEHNGSAGGCDNLIDKIVAGKTLNEYEKMILKYMDFRMKPNVNTDEINSKIMFVVANAIDKQLSTNKFQLFLREHIQKELPGLVSSAVGVYGKEKNIKYILIKKMLEDNKIREKMVNAFISELNELAKEAGTSNSGIPVKMHSLKRIFELLLK